MAGIHKICLMGFYNVRRYISAATAAGMYVSNVANSNSSVIKPDLEIIGYKNYKSLCDIYREVKKKYYPEKDFYKKGK